LNRGIAIIDFSADGAPEVSIISQAISYFMQQFIQANFEVTVPIYEHKISFP